MHHICIFTLPSPVLHFTLHIGRRETYAQIPKNANTQEIKQFALSFLSGKLFPKLLSKQISPVIYMHTLYTRKTTTNLSTSLSFILKIFYQY